MSIFKKLFIFLFLFGIYTTANAAVGDTHPSTCSIFSESDDEAKGNKEAEKGKEDGEEDGGEEEPDCE